VIPRTRRARMLAGIWGTAAVLVAGTWWLARSSDDDPLADLSNLNNAVPTTVVPVSIAALPALPTETTVLGSGLPDPATTTTPPAPTSTIGSTSTTGSTLLEGATTTTAAAAATSDAAVLAAFGAYSVIEGGGVVVRGAVPNEAARSQVLEASQQLTGVQARDELVIDPSSPIPPAQIPLFVPSVVIFEADSAQLLPGARTSLDVIVEILGRSAQPDLIIRGHSDDQGPGDEDYNMKLSDRRGRSVFNYLVAAGVAPERLRLDPRGELEPLFESTDIRVRQLNRRVELRLVPTS
jgi:outer membrane protein OmpA-like peptidoglycan-associated protein